MNKAVDYAERLFVVFVAAMFLNALFHNFSAHPYVALLAISECLPVLLVLIRKPGEITTRPYPFILALVGTTAPLMVRPVQGGLTMVPIALAASIMLLGLVINIYAKLALWSSFGLAPANRGVRAGGPYRFIRHPMYLGYFVTQVGFLIANLSIGNMVKYLITWTIQLLRIREEEKFLMRDDNYRELASRVRFRLVPGVF
ncbi:MAG TPA: isoprenylcysteine carboxylmethyltransferase family protein [Sphingomicrobium sp.]|nr:isoprenylcysteine carboxylmethyltransferase family protein [Sphingomicrobium sp.]